ncbi:hypothetical protein MMC07_001152 [Pseudocyphellaria aurata]|nr:hypothetical protein [Pseudocyphellaria aurata]
MADSQRPYVPVSTPETQYPLIDNDPHIKRVCKYARRSDYVAGTLSTMAGPALMLLWERISPSMVGKGGFARIMRLETAISVTFGFFVFYERSILRFYGFSENKREVEMDMREMVDKVKKNEPLYGKSTLTPHMQAVAARNSRYSGLFLHIIPFANFVNHEQHGVDTAKYYQQAERELAAEQATEGLVSEQTETS